MFSVRSEMEITVYVVGYKGKVQAIFASALGALNSGKHPTPIMELDAWNVVSPSFQLNLKISVGDFVHQEEILKKAVEEWYQNRGNFGPYGDIIQLNSRLVRRFPHSRTHLIYSANFIARRAFHKPGLAADIVPFVADYFGNVFLVGIKRGKNPGKGKIALAGGFCDIHGFHKETGAETAIREAGEEIDLEIIPQDEKILTMKPNAQEIPVSVSLGGCETHTRMILLGTFQTSDEEKLDHLGLKRIYETTAYMLMIPVRSDNVLRADEVVSMFVAKDDAAEIVAIPLAELQKDSIDFAFAHHRTICAEAMRFVPEAAALSMLKK